MLAESSRLTRYQERIYSEIFDFQIIFSSEFAISARICRAESFPLNLKVLQDRKCLIRVRREAAIGRHSEETACRIGRPTARTLAWLTATGRILDAKSPYFKYPSLSH